MLSFELTMPNVGSWNGKWSGEKKKYYLTRKLNAAKEQELDGKSFYYNFGDGWGANVSVEKIDSKEAARRRKVSDGFCGYDWMVEEILKHGRILTLTERRSNNAKTGNDSTD